MSQLQNILSILTLTQRKTVIVLLVLIFIGMLLEMLGIGLVIPVIALLLQDDIVSRYPQLQPLLNSLGNPDQTQLVIGAMVALVGIYLVKNIYLGFLAWLQMGFAFGMQAQLSQRLFTTYLRQPYTFHLQRNSAQLIRNITGEVGKYISGSIIPLLLLTSEGMVLLGFSLLLLVIDSVNTLIVMAVLGLASLGFYTITRKKLSHWGETQMHHETLRVQHLYQGLGGAKDVKLLGREEDFLAQFFNHNKQSLRIYRYQMTVQQLPRLWLELLAVISLALLVTSMIYQGREITSIVPTLGLFTASAFRLIPSVNRILYAMQSLRFGLPGVNNLHEELKLEVPDPVIQAAGDKLIFKNELELREISYRYPAAHSLALINLSIEIRHGEAIGFIGPSGSGKSTLVDVILGLLKPESGHVLVDGNDIQQNMRKWQDNIGYVPQSIYLTDDTLRRNVAFGLSDAQIDDAALNKAVRAAQLDELVESLPDGLETVVGEHGVRLSGGQRQRIGIARALYHDPDVLVLDEATSALDNETEKSVMEAVTALHGRKTVIIVAHRLSTVEHCDRLYRLVQGRVATEGTPDILLNSATLATP